MHTQLSQVQRVALYKKIIINKRVVLSDFTVALMRNATPSLVALEAVNTALKELGWQK